MSMQRPCESFRARRSNSRERPSRIVEGFISVRRWVCASASVVITGLSAAAGIPEKLGLEISPGKPYIDIYELTG